MEAPSTTTVGGVSRLEIVDFHTEGEPIRTVIRGGPDLGPGSAARRLEVLRREHDDLRATVIGEPRGSDVLVGALLLPPSSPAAAAQVIFFNNEGYLGMCVHGTIGVARTLVHLGRIDAGRHRLETPAGDVTFALRPGAAVEVENVLSYRLAKEVEVETEGHGTVRGDVAYGGNWFFLVEHAGPEIRPANAGALTDLAWDVKLSLARAGIRGRDGAEIDHVELFGPPTRADADSKNFVLCPGKAYDRSPCGTGTSAKLACLAADGRLEEGRVWRQESILGSLFEGTYRRVDGGIVPTLTGRAHLIAEATLWVDPADPYARGWWP